MVWEIIGLFSDYAKAVVGFILVLISVLPLTSQEEKSMSKEQLTEERGWRDKKARQLFYPAVTLGVIGCLVISGFRVGITWEIWTPLLLFIFAAGLMCILWGPAWTKIMSKINSDPFSTYSDKRRIVCQLLCAGIILALFFLDISIKHHDTLNSFMK